MDITDYEHRIRPFPFAFLSISFVLFSSYAGGMSSKLLSYAVLLAAVFVAFAFVRSTVCILLLTVPSFIIGLYVGHGIAILLCASALAIALGAFLLRIFKNKAFLLLYAPISYLIAFLASGSYKTAFLSLLCIPACYACAYFTKMKKTRIASICAISFSFGVCVLVFLSAYVLTVYAASEANPFIEAIGDFEDFLIRYYTEEHLKLAERLAQAGADVSSLGLSARDAKTYALSVFGIVPALAIMLSNGIAFVSHRVHLTLLDNAEIISVADIRNIVFVMSPASAIIYILAYVVMAFASYSSGNAAQMTELIAHNVYLILLPGLAITGIFFIIAKISSSRRHVLWVILLVILAFTSMNLALAITAFVGSSFILIMFFRRIAASSSDE